MGELPGLPDGLSRHSIAGECRHDAYRGSQTHCQSNCLQKCLELVSALEAALLKQMLVGRGAESKLADRQAKALGVGTHGLSPESDKAKNNKIRSASLLDGAVTENIAKAYTYIEIRIW